MTTRGAWARLRLVAGLVALCAMACPRNGDSTGPRTAGSDEEPATAGFDAVAEATAHFDAGRYAEALAAFQRAATAMPGDLRIQLNIALCHVALEDPASAARVMEKVVAARPTFTEGWAELGAIYLDLDRPEDAARALEKVLEMAPGHTVARYNLGYAYLDAGRIDDASAQFEKLVAATPDDPDVQAAIGDLAVAKRDLPAAVRHYTHALKLLMEGGDCDAARELYAVAREKLAGDAPRLADLGAAAGEIESCRKAAAP